MSSCSEGARQSNGQIWPWIAAATLITSISWVLLMAMCVANAVIVYRRCSVKRGICVSLKVTGIICYTNVANYTAQESQSRESEPDVEEIYMRKMKRGFVN